MGSCLAAWPACIASSMTGKIRANSWVVALASYTVRYIWRTWPEGVDFPDSLLIVKSLPGKFRRKNLEYRI